MIGKCSNCCLSGRVTLTQCRGRPPSKLGISTPHKYPCPITNLFGEASGRRGRRPLQSQFLTHRLTPIYRSCRISNLGLSICLNMYFSLLVERKVPKERHVRKVPTVLSLRILSPYLRAISPEAKWQRAVRSRLTVWPRCRRHGRPPRVACRYTTARVLYVSSKTATYG